MSRKIALPKGFRIKDGKLVKVHTFRDASHKARCRTSKRQRVVRSTIKSGD